MRTRLAFLLSLAAFFGALGVFLSVVIGATPARRAAADGEGTTAACNSAASPPATTLATSITGSADLVVYDASQDLATLIAYVCIKSGDDTFGGTKHSVPLVNGVYDQNGNTVVANNPLACYQVSGIGTSVATVLRLQVSSACKGISHIDVGYTDGEPSPSPEASPSPAGSPSPTPSPSPSPPGASPTPSPSPSPSAAASPSPTPSSSPSATVTSTGTSTSTATGTATERSSQGTTTPTATATSTGTAFVGK